MVRSATWMALSLLAMGFGVPTICIYSSVYYGFNFIAAAVIAFFALLFAGVLGFFAIEMGPLGHDVPEISAADRKKLDMMRASQRTTLQQLDDVNSLLREVRDLLKAAAE
jgi:hypothetical protein